jgi:c(7)-type cytochrome triheme protein
MACHCGSGVRRRSFAYVASRIGLALLMIAGIVVTVSGCSSARPVLAYVFTGVPAEGADDPPVKVIRDQRRPTYKKPDFSPPKPQLAEGRPDIDWEGRYAELPRDDAGNVAWTKALETKAITPAAGLAADAKDEDPTDMDVELEPAGQAEYKVVFPHKAHTMWLGCPNCHDSIFAMEKGKAKMTMEKLNNGEYCGICHGKVASPDMNGCPACHTAMGKS